MNMKKSLTITIGLVVFFMVSVFFNIVQYKGAKVTERKLAFFESYYGSFEQHMEEATYKREHIMTVYTKIDAPEPQILALKSVIESQTGVQSVQYISAEQALADFKAEHQDDQPTLQALSELGTNPLGANLTITISDPSIRQSLLRTIQSNDKDSVIDKINS